MQFATRYNKFYKGQAIVEFCFFILFFAIFLFTMDYFHRITLTGEILHMTTRIDGFKKAEENQDKMRHNSSEFKETVRTDEFTNKEPVRYKSLYLDSSELVGFERKIKIKYEIPFDMADISGTMSEGSLSSAYESSLDEGKGEAERIGDMLKRESERRKKLSSERPVW